MDVKIVTSEAAYNKFLLSPRYIGDRKISESLYVIFMSQKKVKLDKLFAIGFSVLERSKEFMFRAFYNDIRPALGGRDNVSLVMTDTDSFVLKTTNLDRESVLDRLSPIMDFSNYPVDHARFDESKKAVPGFFKDENKGAAMREIVALKSKCYAFDVVETNKVTARCKGVKRVVTSKFKLETYKDCILDKKSVRGHMNCIRSTNHRLETVTVTKVFMNRQVQIIRLIFH